jgi:hypothetical protein
MAERNPKNHLGGTVALVGGGALLVWLLLRGKGWGLGGGGGKGEHGSEAPGTGTIKEPPAEDRYPCQVFVRALGIDLAGAPTDLPTLVTHCRATGKAHVQITGGASAQTVEDVISALQAAGVTVAITRRFAVQPGGSREL